MCWGSVDSGVERMKTPSPYSAGRVSDVDTHSMPAFVFVRCKYWVATEGGRDGAGVRDKLVVVGWMLLPSMCVFACVCVCVCEAFFLHKAVPKTK